MRARAVNPPGGRPAGDVREPWYRNPFVWLVIAIPGAAVLASVATAVIAVRHQDALVVGDYYRQGKAINEVLARDRRAAELGIVARLSPTRAPAGILWTVRLAPPSALASPGRVAPMLLLAHGTRPGLDRRLPLEEGDAPGVWRTSRERALPPLAPGPWHVQLETPSWRVVGRLFVPLASPWPGDAVTEIELRSALRSGAGARS